MKTKFLNSRPLWLWVSVVSLAGTLAIIPAFGQSIVQSWEGIRGPSPGVGPPPDPAGAPGPAGIIATVNLQISYITKSGAIIWGPVQLPATFFPGNTGTGNQNADPRVIFDQASRRFFVIMQEDHNSRFWLNVAVSRNSDPRTSGAADWIIYRLDATQYTGPNAAGGVNYCGDYPGLAVDGQALYVTYNLFPFDATGVLAGSATNSVLLIMNKSLLIGGSGTLTSLYLSDLRPHPVTPAGGNPGDVMYMVNDWNSSTLKLYAVSQPLGARALNSTLISITDIGAGPTNKAPQPGSGYLVDTLTGKMQGNSTLVGGDIWCCMTRGQPAGPSVAAYWQIRLNGWPQFGLPNLQEEGTVGALTDWNFLPCIGASLAGDVAMTWTRSSSSRSPAMMVAWRTAYSSTFGAPIVVKTSQAPDVDLDSTGTFARWGDFFSVWPDPNDGSFWAVSEWTRADTGTWSTWWAQISMPPRDFYVRWNAPNPGTQDGSLACPYVTVGAAHANISSGTLHIFGGHYNEQLTLNKTVTLQAYSGGDVTIGAP